MLRRALQWLHGLRVASAATEADLAANIPDALWANAVAAYPFLSELEAPRQQRLRVLSAAFLQRKEFHGAHGLEVTDAMALCVAAQACLPLVDMGEGLAALGWYGDFVGIVLHPGEMLAKRQSVDEAGVVHSWSEALTGEVMEQGPLTLSWQDVASAGAYAASGYNVVIHEFVHVMDMHGKGGAAPDGCPLLPVGFMGHPTVRAARKAWQATMQASFEKFAEAVARAERFGGIAQEPWLDAYAAQSVDEFFAVTAEAYFVARQRFAQEFPELLALYDAFFKRVPG